jgi:DsbC/DsbD-like thiol-disulfide interchange protein
VIKYEHQPDNTWIFIVKWRGQLNRRCGGVSKRWLIDGFRLPLMDFPYPAELETQPLGDFSWEVPVHVPAYFVSTGHINGTYRARFMYSCNKLQEIVFPIIDEPTSVPFSIPVGSVEQGPPPGPEPDNISPR